MAILVVAENKCFSLCISTESILRMNEVLILGSSLSPQNQINPFLFISYPFIMESNILRYHELSFSSWFSMFIQKIKEM